MNTIEREAWELDQAVAAATGRQFTTTELANFSPSTDWRQGGPIIEHEKMTVCSPHPDAPAGREWQAVCRHSHEWGATPLIAAMRAYVAAQLSLQPPPPTGHGKAPQKGPFS